MPSATRKPKPAASARRKHLRVVAIGAGGMANTVHYPALAALPEVSLEALFDLDTGRLNETADKYGVDKRYTNYRQMIEDVTPDAVYAIGQPHLMYDVWVWCLQQGLHLFVEKPLGITMHMARTAAYLAEKHGCITQVGFQRRSCPLLVNLRNRCLERGPLVHVVCTFYKFLHEPLLAAPDHLIDDGVHAIDTLRWMCGGNVVEIESVARRVGVPDLNFYVALLHFDNGAIGVLMNSWSSGKRLFRVEMHGQGICAEGSPDGVGTVWTDGDTEGETSDIYAASGSRELYVHGGFLAKHQEFVECLRTKRQPGSCFADALLTMEVAERIRAQNLLAGR